MLRLGKDEVLHGSAMCLLRSVTDSVVANVMAALLSSCKSVGSVCGYPNSCSIPRRNLISLVQSHAEITSDSIVDCAIAVWDLDLHATGALLMKITHPVRDAASLFSAYAASVKAFGVFGSVSQGSWVVGSRMWRV